MGIPLSRLSRIAIVVGLTLSLLGSIGAYAVPPSPNVGRLHAINIQLENLEGRLAEALSHPPNPVEPEAISALNGIAAEADNMIQLVDAFLGNPGPPDAEVMAELEAITESSQEISALV
ncbi:MAG: hypothetical protein ACREA4_12520, partial [Nitrososphaera sp.]